MEKNFEKYSNKNGTIYHGDALDILSSIPDESVDLVFVDPPYNIGKNLAYLHSSVDRVIQRCSIAYT